jgi:DNA-binding MarR family transcriptional regulator
MFASMQALLSPADQLTDELLGFVAYLTKGAQSEVLQVAAALDLSLSQLRALHALDAADRPLALHEVADRIGLSVAATGRAVDVMVRGGLASRREDEADRRVKRIAITDAGRDAVNRLIAARREGMTRFVATLSDPERERLSAALAPILARPEIQSACQGVLR